MLDLKWRITLTMGEVRRVSVRIVSVGFYRLGILKKSVATPMKNPVSVLCKRRVGCEAHANARGRGASCLRPLPLLSDVSFAWLQLLPPVEKRRYPGPQESSSEA